MLLELFLSLAQFYSGDYNFPLHNIPTHTYSLTPVNPTCL